MTAAKNDAAISNDMTSTKQLLKQTMWLTLIDSSIDLIYDRFNEEAVNHD